MTLRTFFAFLACSTTCWTRGFPVSAAIIFPGNRLDAKRAGMTTVAAKVGPREDVSGQLQTAGRQYCRGRSIANCQLTIRNCQLNSETAEDGAIAFGEALLGEAAEDAVGDAVFFTEGALFG